MNTEIYKAYFNFQVRDKVWYKKPRKLDYGIIYGERWKRSLRAMLEGYQRMLEVDAHSQATVDMPRTIAYKIAGTKGIPTKIYSKEGRKGDEKVVWDHFLGATLIGKTIYEAWSESGMDTNWLVETWFYDNLWLFGSIGLSKPEHDRLKGFDLSANEKLNLIHYKKAGIELDLEDGWNTPNKARQFFNI